MSNLLCQYGPYGPFILHGQENRRERKSAWESAALKFYEIVVIEDGELEYMGAQARRTCSSPCALFLQPGMEHRIRVPRSVAWSRLCFDVVYQRLRHTRRRRTAFTHAGSKEQPSALEVWGTCLPLEVPTVLAQSCIDTVLWCNARWWRGPLPYAQANLRLGSWLLDFVDSQLGNTVVSADDWAGQLTKYCRDQMCHGISVNQLARGAGMSRQRLRQRVIEAFGETPRRFLDRLRLDHACRLLRTSDMSIASIARHCGYASATVFGRRFRRAIGRSARDWRRLNEAGTSTFGAR